jgi:hypothetical protein
MEENVRREHRSHYQAWKWIIGILIVLAAFCIGFACGRFSAFFGDWGYGYGYPMMGPWMMHGGYGYPYGGYGAPRQDQAVPPPGVAATTTPAPYYYPMWRMMGGYYYPQATSTQ